MAAKKSGCCTSIGNAVNIKRRLSFLKLLFRWQGGIWQCLWKDVLLFLIGYIIIAITYKCAISKNPTAKDGFQNFVTYLTKMSEMTSLAFLIGFFVSTVMGKWWSAIMTLPWMGGPTYFTQTLINESIAKSREKSDNPGDYEQNEKSIQMAHGMRRTMLRYMNLATIFALMGMSEKIQKRFYCEPEKTESKGLSIRKLTKKIPIVGRSEKEEGRVSIRKQCDVINNDPAVKRIYGNLILEEEIEVLEGFEQQLNPSETYIPDFYVPLQWATRVCDRALKAGFIANHKLRLKLTELLNDFRGTLATNFLYAGFPVPFVYIQLVTFAVYLFVFTEIFKNHLERENGNKDSFEISQYIPIMGLLKFFMYMGWFKVGLNLYNPYSDECKFYPINEILDENMQFAVDCASTTDERFPNFLNHASGMDTNVWEKVLQREAEIKAQIDAELENAANKPALEKTAEPAEKKNDAGTSDPEKIELVAKA